MIGRFFPIPLGLAPERYSLMLGILTLVALLLGGTVTPHDVVNGGPSNVTSADVVNGGPSIAPKDVVNGGPS